MLKGTEGCKPGWLCGTTPAKLEATDADTSSRLSETESVLVCEPECCLGRRIARDVEAVV